MKISSNLKENEIVKDKQEVFKCENKQKRNWKFESEKLWRKSIRYRFVETAIKGRHKKSQRWKSRSTLKWNQMWNASSGAWWLCQCWLTQKPVHVVRLRFAATDEIRLVWFKRRRSMSLTRTRTLSRVIAITHVWSSATAVRILSRTVEVNDLVAWP